MSNLKTIFSSLLVGFLVLAGSTYAAAPACPATTPGCNPPINVSTNLQTKSGPLTIGGVLTSAVNFVLGGSMGMKSGSLIKFNSLGAGTDEGQIGYGSSLLNIYGGGTSPNRKVVIYDQICSDPATCKSVANIINGGGGTSGVSQITAGSNVTISPTTGTGNVTVNANPSAGGLYGVCEAKGTAFSATPSPTYTYTCTAKSPATCGQASGAYTDQCRCPSGYTIVTTSYIDMYPGTLSAYRNAYHSCYKN
ncbi:MAG: hypothetical protein WCW56_03145 [Candidatus Paceibacterota bacterium]|jgi:hypothetical protein